MYIGLIPGCLFVVFIHFPYCFLLFLFTIYTFLDTAIAQPSPNPSICRAAYLLRLII